MGKAWIIQKTIPAAIRRILGSEDFLALYTIFLYMLSRSYSIDSIFPFDYSNVSEQYDFVHNGLIVN
jgi:hypothetical protein